MEKYVERSEQVDTWEQLIDYLSRDMDPQDIDVCELAQRFKDHIDQMQQNNLEVPAKAVKVCSHLVKIKAHSVAGTPIHLDDEESPVEDGSEDNESTVQYRDGPTLDVPAKPQVSRRVTKSELKKSLADAIELKQERENRVEERRDFEEDLNMDEETLQDKINSLISRLSSLMGGGSEETVQFDELVEEDVPEHQLERFLHVLHLEDQKKVRCKQDEFLGNLQVRPKDL
jgi:chromatin segregation and condensation protein Rec8/ScpA/Scc1 (kleisin family)